MPTGTALAEDGAAPVEDWRDIVRKREAELQPVWLGKGGEGQVADLAVLPMEQGDGWLEGYSIELRVTISACLTYDPGQ